MQHIDGPVALAERDERWLLLSKCRYGEDYYAHPDSELCSDVLRAQWVYPGGLIATLDYYVRKDDDGGAETQWKVVERVHFYDPDESWQQIEARFFQHDFYPATVENLEIAEKRCLTLLDHRDSSHLSEWWATWREEG